MKYTLLDITQSILSSLNSDEVNSIGDTVESRQVAECIKTSFINMQGRYDLPEHNQPIQLISSEDATKPTIMYIPDGVNRIEWVKYFDSNPSDGSTITSQFVHDLNLDIKSTATATSTQAPPGYLDVCLLSQEDFLWMTQRFNTKDSSVGTFTLPIEDNGMGFPNTFKFNYKNNITPHYFAIISNKYVLFDSYDATQDNTLQSAKTMCMAWVVPDFVMEDTWVPPLDDQQFPMLLNEAKALAFFELKQQNHEKAEHEVLRQLFSLQKFKAIANRPTPFELLPNFGRRIGSGGYAVYRR